MSARDLIAEAIHRSDCGCTDWHAKDPEDGMYDQYASAVVDAIRAMSIEQQADLLGGGSEIETVPLFITSVGSGEVLRRWSRSRVVGPWQEKP